jgi:tetratricopeptide (TPR) repeat protein
MAFCEQCGNQLNESAKFCGKCGSPVVGQAETPQAPGGGEPPAQQAFNAGLACIEAKQYDEAIAHFTEALHYDPENIDSYYKRGLVYYVKQDYDKAVADFNQTIRINPEIAEVYSIRGDAYACKEDNDKAIADYTKAIQLAPDVAETYGSRAMAYMEKGDFAKARADVERGLQIDPENETVADAAEQLKEAGAQGGGVSGPSSCGQCGAPLEAGEAFCANCGAKVGVGGGGQFMQTASSCSQCGAPLEAGEAFCANCGAKVGGTPAARPQYQPPQIQQQTRGEQVLREGDFAYFPKILTCKRGKLLLYKDRLEFKGEIDVAIPINEIKSVEANVTGLDIKTANKKYSFLQAYIVNDGSMKEMEKRLLEVILPEMESWANAINKVKYSA